jgi:hypothetical protein
MVLTFKEYRSSRLLLRGWRGASGGGMVETMRGRIVSGGEPRVGDVDNRLSECREVGRTFGPAHGQGEWEGY